MRRMTPQEVGRLGGLKGGRSRSAAKQAAARRNGFQKTNWQRGAEALPDLQPGCGCVITPSAPTPTPRPVIVAAQPKENA